MGQGRVVKPGMIGYIYNAQLHCLAIKADQAQITISILHSSRKEFTLQIYIIYSYKMQDRY